MQRKLKEMSKNPELSQKALKELEKKVQAYNDKKFKVNQEIEKDSLELGKIMKDIEGYKAKLKESEESLEDSKKQYEIMKTKYKACSGTFTGIMNNTRKMIDVTKSENVKRGKEYTTNILEDARGFSTKIGTTHGHIPSFRSSATYGNKFDNYDLEAIPKDIKKTFDSTKIKNLGDTLKGISK
eukprot:Mrub_10605.p1 GENE.Mrub_10605~~Mrub_10605.p1  ORF type:complete len:197 (+),score=44.12 Mrub_10605:43-591(+)